MTASTPAGGPFAALVAAFRGAAGERARTTAVLVLLLGVGLVADGLDRRHDRIGDLAAAVFSTGPNAEDRDRETAGYYEGILDEGRRVSRMNPGFGNKEDARPAWNFEGIRWRDDFLLFDVGPNVHVEGQRGFTTNAEGLVDRMYPHERTPGVRRIAFIGDSIVVAQGAGVGGGFEAQLEEDLTRRPACPSPAPPEIINFAVGGYRLTQLVDSIPARARSYKPDAYVVGLTALSVSRIWSDHLTTLFRQGKPLKYPYLERIVRDARLNVTDPEETMRAKLTRFRDDAIRGSLGEVKRMAAEDQADLVVLLLPSVRPLRELREIFDGVPELVQSLDIPLLDLVDAFAAVDLETIKVGMMDGRLDPHPDRKGHAILAHAIRAQIDQPTSPVRRGFLGQTCGPAVTAFHAAPPR